MDHSSKDSTNLSALKQAYLAIEKLQGRLDAMEQARREPVAIVGAACRFPGGANDLESYWLLLRSGVDAITEVPPERWDIDAYYDPNPDSPGKMSTRQGGFLKDIAHFDPQLFGISPREASSMDPQQRLLLEVTWEALENAGQAPDGLSGSSTGVFVGIVNNDYAQLQLTGGGIGRIDTYFGSGTGHSLASGRISYVFGLQGPSISIDTACSSSLVAVHLAVQSLRSGECRLALAGGTNAILTPEVSIALSKFHFMAPDGRCKAFDARADGFVRGEGCGMVVLKRLSDALADGDQILAIILGSAVNQDGASSGLTAPNGPAQESVVRSALANAGIRPAEVSYIEAHGTGTSLGDPIEVQALGNVFTRDPALNGPIYIGSVKTNLGHLESVAGIASLIKVILALTHQEIPPSLHFQTPNPHIPWDQLPFKVPAQPVPWKTDQRRVAGVSSFGVSGTNAHIVLAGAPAEPPAAPGPERPVHLLTLSAQSEKALRELAGRYHDHLGAHPQQSLPDICRTANRGRAQLAHRLAVAASSADQAVEQLALFREGRTQDLSLSGQVQTSDQPRIAFLFTGQGSQYPGMGRRLYETQPTFKAVLDRCDALLRPHLDRPLLSVMFPEDEGAAAALNDTAYTQPAIFALECGLAELWRSWGIQPAAVIGHSAGEYAAACAAGVFSLEEGLQLVAQRGRLMSALPPGGGMAAVFTGEEQAAAAIQEYRDQLAIAAINGPENTVISGREAALQAVLERLADQGIQSRRLTVSHAFHSPLVDPILADFARIAAEVTYRSPRIAMISNLTGELEVGPGVASAAYWLQQLRQPVRFAQGMEKLHQLGYRLFIEAGPSPTLSGMGRRCLPEGGIAWLPSLRQGRDDWQQLLHSLGALYVRGVQVDWEGFDQDYVSRGRRLSLPTYPFQHKRYWISESPRPRPAAALPGRGAGPLVGQRLRSALNEHQFELRTNAGAYTFLADHRVYGSVVLPAAAYLEIALEAASAVYGPGGHTLGDVVIHEPLIFPGEEDRFVQTILTPGGRDRSSFKILSSQPADEHGVWRLHMSGEILAHQAAPTLAHASIDEIRSRCSEKIDAGTHYQSLEGRGISLGPSLQVLGEIHRREGEAIGAVQLSAEQIYEANGYQAHPALLDACLQLLGNCLPLDLAETDAYLPAAIDRFTILRSPGSRVLSHVSVRSGAGPKPSTLTADVRMLDEAGEVIAELEGLRLRKASRQQALASASPDFSEWLYQFEWEPQPLQRRQPESGLPGLEEVAAQVRPLFESLQAEHDLKSHAELIARLGELSAAYIRSAFEQLGWRLQPGERVSSEHLAAELGIAAQHGRLLERLLAILAEDGLLEPDGPEWKVLSAPELIDLQARFSDLEARFPASRAQISILARCGGDLARALTGRADPLQLLFPDGSFEAAEQLYQETPEANVFNRLAQAALEAIAARAAETKNLRILEVGAGTGGTTSFVLPALPQDKTRYLFTDISPAFLARARQKFTGYPIISFQRLDIERDPQAQGIEPHAFDVVLASNVLHATTDLRQTLGHVRRLLAPGGTLVLLEATGPERWIDITFGLTEGWWRFSDADLRRSSPLISGPAWLELLAEAGFVAAACLPEGDSGVQQALILAQAPPAAGAGPDAAGDWLIFADSRGLGRRAAEHLAARGERCQIILPGTGSRIGGPGAWEVDPARPEDFSRLLENAADGPLKGVLHLWNLDIPPAAEAAPASFEPGLALGTGSILHLVQALGKARQTPRIWIATHGAQPIHPQPYSRQGAAQAAAWGLGKAVHLEHPEFRCTLIDLDPAAPVEGQVGQLVDEIGAPDHEELVAYRRGARLAARLARFDLPDPENGSQSQPLHLVTTGSGILDDLALVPSDRREPGPGEVEIRVQATGLNFRDVLNALALRTDPEPLGSECAGTITAVGAGVSGFSPGDRVVAVVSDGFASYVTVETGFVARIPAGLQPGEAATYPLAFMTAHYALNWIAGMARGSRVLIHAAAGGVGQAAVQLARQAGAEIFGTAGSPEKRAFLKSQGVHHVLDSRSLDFGREIMELTHGEGVDVILNSLAGEFIPHSLSALSERGCFLEIGKNEIWTSEQAARLKPQAAYHIVDLAALMVENPKKAKSLFQEIMAAAEAGEIQPLPFQTFPLEEIAEAFRSMAQAKHTGKIVVVQPNRRGKPGSAGSRGQTRPGSSLAKPDPEASYLITGGLSGLGLLVAGRLVENGARHLVLAGRRRASEAAQTAIRGMEAAGASVHAVRCDITRPEQVSKLLEEIQAAMPPLRGIIHSAGVLDDGVLMKQEWPRFAKVIVPKVDGAWHLHRLTLDQELDFFVLFSSTAALLGSPGQSNHSAANTCMDALAHLRRAHGYPALSINWGVWSEVGSAAEHRVGERVELQGIGAISPQQGLQVLELLMERDLAQVGVFPIQWGQYLRHYPNGQPPRWLSGFSHQDRQHPAQMPGPETLPGAGPSDLRRRLAGASPNQQFELLLSFTSDQASRVLGLEPGDDLDLRKPLNEQGLDSLMAVELRNLLSTGLQPERSLPATLVFDYPSVEAITGFLASQVLSVETNGTPPARAKGPETVDELLDALEGLPDEEIERLYMDQMRGQK